MKTCGNNSTISEMESEIPLLDYQRRQLPFEKVLRLSTGLFEITRRDKSESRKFRIRKKSFNYRIGANTIRLFHIGNTRSRSDSPW